MLTAPGVCRVCGGNTYMRHAHVSLQDSNFGDSCAGWGKVLDFFVPFCSGCEPVPDERGCIHIPTHPIGLPLFQPGLETELMK